MRRKRTEGTVDDDQIVQVIDRARALSEELPEPFRSLTYRVLLEAFLRGTSQRTVADAGPPPELAGVELEEFLASKKKVRTHTDRVVAIAYYHYRTSGGSGVTTKDLLDAYTRSRERKPQNFPDVISACVRRGHVVESERRDGMKSWTITRTGEQYVEGTL